MDRVRGLPARHRIGVTPLNFSQRSAGDDPVALAVIADLNLLRATLQVVVLLAPGPASTHDLGDLAAPDGGGG